MYLYLLTTVEKKDFSPTVIEKLLVKFVKNNKFIWVQKD